MADLLTTALLQSLMNTGQSIGQSYLTQKAEGEKNLRDLYAKVLEKGYTFNTPAVPATYNAPTPLPEGVSGPLNQTVATPEIPERQLPFNQIVNWKNPSDIPEGTTIHNPNTGSANFTINPDGTVTTTGGSIGKGQSSLAMFAAGQGFRADKFAADNKHKSVQELNAMIDDQENTMKTLAPQGAYYIPDANLQAYNEAQDKRNALIKLREQKSGVNEDLSNMDKNKPFSNKVKVISPDGKTAGLIPKNQLDEALKQGYKLAK